MAKVELGFVEIEQSLDEHSVIVEKAGMAASPRDSGAAGCRCGVVHAGDDESAARAGRLA